MADRGRRGGKRIDTVHWAGVNWSALGFAAGTIAVNVGVAQHLPETLMRFRGRWGAQVGGQLGPASLAEISCGLIQVPEGTGTTVLWSPFTDDDAPWIWWDTTFVGNEESVTDVIAVQSILGAQYSIDSKAMRKLRNTELQVVIENTTINGAVNVDVYGSGRVLAGS